MKKNISEFVIVAVILISAVMVVGATWGTRPPTRYKELAKWQIARCEELVRNNPQNAQDLVAWAKKALPELRKYDKHSHKDYNNDGTIDEKDLVIFMRGYGASCVAVLDSNDIVDSKGSLVADEHIQGQLQVIMDMNDPNLLKQAMEFLETRKD